MKVVLQRVRCAKVEVKNRVVGQINHGLLVLLGVAQGDTPQQAQSLAEKIQLLRIFSDDTGKMNKSVQDINGAILVISQFTLFANTDRGRRPSFEQAASANEARNMYESFIAHLRSLGTHVEAGIFGAMMTVSLENDGPVTLIIDTN